MRSLEIYVGGWHLWTKPRWTETLFTDSSLLAWAVWFAVPADLGDAHSLPLLLFSFFLVCRFSFCCYSFLALFVIPHVHPFLRFTL